MAARNQANTTDCQGQEGLEQEQLFYNRTGEVLCRIPRCGGGTASLGVGTLAPSIEDGKGN